MTSPRIGSLFTGYGGLDLATRTVIGGRLVWVSDNNPAAATVLAAHHPQVPNLGDITAVDWTTVPPVDVLTAGFPCQDISNAGRRAGIERGERSGLWRTVAQACRILRPDYVFVENVAALTIRGLDTVLADLAENGFDAQWTCLRACDVGAPHQRNRLFLIARLHPELSSTLTECERFGPRPGRDEAPNGRPSDPSGRRCDRLAADPESHRRGEGRAEPARIVGRPDAAQCGNAAADALCGGREGRSPIEIRQQVERVAAGRASAGDWARYEPAIRRWESILGRPAPSPTVLGQRGGHVLNPVFVEWMMGLPGGWVTDIDSLSRSRMLHLLGNGVVPQQATAAYTQLLHQLAGHGPCMGHS